MGKIVVLKKPAISKIIVKSFITTVLNHIINELENIQKAFRWRNFTPKIKPETPCNDYKAGELKNVDIPNKIEALQCSWQRILYDNSFHEWKVVLIYLIEKSFGSSFKFHSIIYSLKLAKPRFPIFLSKKVAYKRWYNLNNLNGSFSGDFDEKAGKLHVKNQSCVTFCNYTI